MTVQLQLRRYDRPWPQVGSWWRWRGWRGYLRVRVLAVGVGEKLHGAVRDIYVTVRTVHGRRSRIRLDQFHKRFEP